MEKNNELYKIYQIESVFVTKYGFNEVILKKYQDYFQKESWLANYTDKNYQVIRISFSDTNFSVDEVSRINEYLDYFKKDSSFDIKFLDIHINNDEYDQALELYDYINIEDGYYAGIDLSNIYPNIYNTIHNSNNPGQEMKKQFNFIKKQIDNKRKKLPFLKRNKFIFTYITIFICCLMYFVQTILSLSCDNTSAFLLLGADYKILTLGCKEYYRLFTYAFLHSGIAHLFCNMVSLYSLGRIVEYAHGHKGYLVILITSIICGSLTQGILSDNELCIGMSGGIYGLFVAYIIDIAKSRLVDVRRLVPVILLNLLLNFSTTTAWMCHLGGAIAGIASYFAISEKKNYPAIGLVIVLVVSLIFKYISISKISTFYGGTDLAYINALKSFNFDTTNIANKIMSAYIKYGG